MSTRTGQTAVRYIRPLRHAAGLSIAELARKAQVGRSHLSELESGHLQTDPTIGTLEKLARVLGRTVASLVTEPFCGACMDVARPGFTCNVCGVPWTVALETTIGPGDDTACDRCGCPLPAGAPAWPDGDGVTCADCPGGTAA